MRPTDRGEVAHWLGRRARGAQGGSRPAGADASPARRRVAANVAWDLERGKALATPGRSPRKRPGALLGFGSAETRLEISPYLRLMPRFAEGEKSDWTSASRLGFRAHLDWGTHLAISTGMFAAEVDDARSFADPLVAGSDFVLHEEEVTLSARWGPLRFRTGRDRHRWGPGVSGTLLLSDAGEPFNFVEYQLRISDDLCFLALTGETGRNANRSGVGQELLVGDHLSLEPGESQVVLDGVLQRLSPHESACRRRVPV